MRRPAIGEEAALVGVRAFSDGSVVIVGTAPAGTDYGEGPTKGNLTILRYDPVGHLVWERDGTNITTEQRFLVTAGDDVVLAGTGDSGAFGDDTISSSFAIRFRGSDGTTVWKTTLGGTPSTMAGSASGDVAVSTFPYRFSNDSPQVTIYAADGSTKWTRPFAAAELIYSSTNQLVLGNWNDTSSTIFLDAFDSAGNALWSKSYTGLDMELWSTTASPDGHIVMGGVASTGSLKWNASTIEGTGVANSWAPVVLVADANGTPTWGERVGEADWSPVVGSASDGSIGAALQYVDPASSSACARAAVAKWAPDGQLSWRRDFQTTTCASDPQDAVSLLGIAFTSNAVHVTGGALGTIDFGIGPASYTGQVDVVLVP